MPAFNSQFSIIYTCILSTLFYEFIHYLYILECKNWIKVSLFSLIFCLLLFYYVNSRFQSRVVFIAAVSVDRGELNIMIVFVGMLRRCSTFYVFSQRILLTESFYYAFSLSIKVHIINNKLSILNLANSKITTNTNKSATPIIITVIPVIINTALKNIVLVAYTTYRRLYFLNCRLIVNTFRKKAINRS